MDLELLRTFLEVERTRHFGRAAERLCVTQSAVSARIKLLEDTLGTPLFVRKRHDIQPTAAGQRLKRHAEAIVTAWQRARQETALEPEYRDTLALGAPVDLWQSVLGEGLGQLARALPDMAFRFESLGHELLVKHVEEGTLDLALVFDPPGGDVFEVRDLGAFRLVLVSTRPDQSLEAALGRGHVGIDWGPGFARRLARLLPDRPPPAVHAANAIVALQCLKAWGGTAYLPEAVLRQRGGDSPGLYPVADAPSFERRVHGVHRADSAREGLVRATLDVMGGVLAGAGDVARKGGRTAAGAEAGGV